MNDSVSPTELSNPRTRGLDTMDLKTLIDALAADQARAVEAVRERKEDIALAVENIAARLREGGHLHYVGAGTSGRLAFLDASECPPTFGTPPDLVCAHLAGGPAALSRAVEGAEDNGDAGAHDMLDHVGAGDAVIGLSASGGPAYVLGALVTARAAGAYTVAVSNAPHSKLASVADQDIFLDTGPEALTGSTRLKAGTAQKILLNIVSTAVMVRLGKVYDNLMVDVVATNKKLRNRALRLVMQLAEVDERRAAQLLQAANGRVKVAVVMAHRNLDAGAARQLLESAGNSLRASL
ncbi:MAG: N-acetylmuramic acid 6-phosphate etherase [Candidatus Meridianibacter frigidus]|nr:MAG: N-acetylmuramic acid 6-phosphate etherase [Candidatus Eremiobacteraeota bacterium]